MALTSQPTDVGQTGSPLTSLAVHGEVADVYSLLFATGEGAAERASRMRDEPPTVTEESYESMETDIDIEIHADVYYNRIRAACGGNQTGQVTQPSKSDIIEAVESVLPDDERL